MIDLTKIKHHAAIEEVVDVLCNKTQNTDRGFFRVEVAFFLAKMAANMRATILTKDRGSIPVNLYTLALATSGYGKGHSVHIIEQEFMAGFKARFMDETFNLIAEDNLWKIAIARAAISGKEEQAEKDNLDREYTKEGNISYTFDSGTGPAVKQTRNKMIMANIGAINLQIDEIGSNLVGNVEILNVFLELFDQGLTKAKLTKNTAENVRSQELDGKTPTNALLFGTPDTLLDGGQVEDQFYSFLQTGYARRCLFGWGHETVLDEVPDAAEVYHRLISTNNTTTINHWANRFSDLADPVKYGWEMSVDDEVGIELIAYKLECERIAATYPKKEEIHKAEMSHRYFKALKLAGALAFVDESSEIELYHLHCAMKLVEESGESFKGIMTREKNHVKLAKHIAETPDEVTHSDLFEAFPFYKSGQAARNDIMNLAQSWGYKNNVIIKKTFSDGIEFFAGDTLQEATLDETILSYSNHFGYNYEAETPSFDQLADFVAMPDMHFCNHGFINKHRNSENAIPGFNMIVIDCDGEVTLDTVHDLLKDYEFMTYTTKRHTEAENRFRLMIPISFILELDKDEYKNFMTSFMDWLPFKSDEAANQREKKWMTNANCIVHHNKGEVLDPVQFIPKTSKNEDLKKQMADLGSLDNLERWFAQRMANGNRNQHMIRFALTLVDAGIAYQEVENQVVSFNSRMAEPMSSSELRNTVLVTTAKKYA